MDSGGIFCPIDRGVPALTLQKHPQQERSLRQWHQRHFELRLFPRAIEVQAAHACCAACLPSGHECSMRVRHKSFVRALFAVQKEVQGKKGGELVLAGLTTACPHPTRFTPALAVFWLERQPIADRHATLAAR